MSNITNKQDIEKENQELLECAARTIGSLRRGEARDAQAFVCPRTSLARRLGVYCALTQQERHQLEGTSVENSYKDLFTIAALGDARDTRKREGVALADPDDPASSLEEAKDRAGLGLARSGAGLHQIVGGTMSNIRNKKETDRRLFERADMRELAAHPVEVHMDTKRSEVVLGALKRHFRRREPLMGSILIEEIDRAMVEYKAESAE